MKDAPVADKKLISLAEKIGSFIEYWGFKQVHGKVWTLTFLSPHHVDANYLKSNLKISKALTSMTIKDLLHYNVIIEVEKDKPGTQKYKVNPDLTNVILAVLQNRELHMLEEIHHSFNTLKNSPDNQNSNFIDASRLDELGAMVQSAKILLKGMTECNKVDFKDFENVTTLKDR